MELKFSEQDESISFQESCEFVRSVNESSIKRSLRADVPVGLYLSGGIDSSILALVMAEVLQDSFHTFSVVFEDESFNERSFQKSILEKTGAKNTSVICAYDDVLKVFPEVVKHAETPLFRTAPAPMFLLSKAVHEAGHKVVLSGEGADEIFWGYDTYRELFIRLLWARNPESEWRPSLLQNIFPYFKQYQEKRYFNFLKSFYKKSLLDLDNRYYSLLPRWSTNQALLRLLNPDFDRPSVDELKESIESRLPSDFSSWDHFRRCQFLEMEILLAGYLLSTQGDRMQMAHSVEGRFPFLDSEIVSLTSSFPNMYKCKGLRDKYILREAYREMLPKSIYQRAKFAYRAPDFNSFYKGNWKSTYVEELMSPNYTKEVGIFDIKKVQQLHKKGRELLTSNPSTRDNMAVTFILSTHLLHDQFIVT